MSNPAHSQTPLAHWSNASNLATSATKFRALLRTTNTRLSPLRSSMDHAREPGHGQNQTPLRHWFGTSRAQDPQIELRQSTRVWTSLAVNDTPGTTTNAIVRKSDPIRSARILANCVSIRAIRVWLQHISKFKESSELLRKIVQIIQRRSAHTAHAASHPDDNPPARSAPRNDRPQIAS